MRTITFNDEHALILFVVQKQLKFVYGEGSAASDGPRFCSEGILGCAVDKSTRHWVAWFDCHVDHGADLNNQ